MHPLKVKILEKSLLEGRGNRNFYFDGGILLLGGRLIFLRKGRRSHNFEEKIKIALYQYKELFWNN